MKANKTSAAIPDVEVWWGRRRFPEAHRQKKWIAKHFPTPGRRRQSLLAFGYWLTFYGGFFLYTQGIVPTWVFVTVGFFVYIRYFDATHEEIHTRRKGSRLFHYLRYVFSVSGPLQLGYTQIAKIHRLHHALEGTDKDPDIWLMQGTLLSSSFHSLIQPEEAAVRYIKANGWERRLVFDLTLHFSIWMGLFFFCTLAQFILYNVVVRTANAVSWWVFTHILHRRKIYHGVGPVLVPRLLQWAWLVLIGRQNLNAITYHYLHHTYDFVHTNKLPELSRLLRAGNAEGSLGT